MKVDFVRERAIRTVADALRTSKARITFIEALASTINERFGSRDDGEIPTRTAARGKCRCEDTENQGA
ncbi:MAG: hypothetical protein A2Y77_14725 [Planctomycetes bacterium RBG_13_62_9]|nr:MAG: hypothetical protein A2Y77_14725 [Planctomycetes bacterium RBG_13_62_9]